MLGDTGEEITLRGVDFGAEQGMSFITIAGIAPTASKYRVWHDTEIRFTVPDFFDSGLVVVHTAQKKSNPVFLATRISLPRTASSLLPTIHTVSPATATIGSVITINGSNFGTSREKGAVLFSLDESAWIKAVEYIQWSEQELRVRVPDGAQHGFIKVHTKRGETNHVPLTIQNRVGSKLLTDKRSYSLSYSVTVQVLEDHIIPTLYLWVPKPMESPSQRNVRLVSRTYEPFIDDYQGSSLYRFDALDHSINLEVSYQLDGYAVQAVMQEPAPGSSISIDSSLIPPSDPTVQTLAQTIVGRETNLFIKAQRIYEWMRRELQFSPDIHDRTLSAIIETRETDSYGAALLFCALARDIGIQAQAVAGIYRGTNHYWAEFWLDTFGWVPVDTVNAQFGTLDNQHILFSRGELKVPHIDQRGQVSSAPARYAFQNIWEEVVGDPQSYTTEWSAVQIEN
ncbi:MAG: IPT/TIG domain-containing protein [Treponema sp.]|nr:IPT/TIG domain-containing protein [Treponema sp.]